jgi:hypothetical protein
MPGKHTREAALPAAGQHARSRGLDLGLRLVFIGCAGLLVIALAWTAFGLRGVPLILVELTTIGAMSIY